MADVNWNLAVTPDPFKQIAEGRDYSRSVFDQAALLKAGSQYAAGDPASAANTVASRGDFATAGKLQDLGTARTAGAQYAAGDPGAAVKTFASAGRFDEAGKLQDQQIKTVEAQQNAMGRAGSFLDAAIKQGLDPGQAWNMAKQSLQAAAIPPDRIAEIEQTVKSDPTKAAATLGFLAKLEGHQVGDDYVFINPYTHQEVSRIKGTKAADQLRAANEPFDAQGNPNAAVQDFRIRQATAGAALRAANAPAPGTGVGKSLEERDDDILINGDPSTPEYAASFARRSRPIVSFDPQTGQPRTVTPDVSWARQPTYRGVAGGQPQAGGPPPPSMGGGEPPPKAPGQPTITGGGASPARATFEANASLAQKDIAVAQSVFFPHGIDKELNRNELVRSNLPQTPGRAAMQALERAIETILRIRSGAAIGAAEVAKYMNLYGPSVFDSDAGAATKLKRLNEFFEESKQIAAGREGTSNTPPPPAEPPPQAQPQPQAVPRVPYAPGRGPTGAAQPNKTLRFQDLP